MDLPGTVLFPDEEFAIANAVDKRRDEFTTARACARAALGKLGLDFRSIPFGARGEPIWPSGVVGSITHCDGYRAAAVAYRHEMLTIGIDGEVNESISQEILAAVSVPAEVLMLGALAVRRQDVCWDRLLFSAKESVYKAWFPVMQQSLGFQDVEISLQESGRFTATILVPHGLVPSTLHGRWRADAGLLLTAVSVAER